MIRSQYTWKNVEKYFYCCCVINNYIPPMMMSLQKIINCKSSSMRMRNHTKYVVAMRCRNNDNINNATYLRRAFLEKKKEKH